MSQTKTVYIRRLFLYQSTCKQMYRRLNLLHLQSEQSVFYVHWFILSDTTFFINNSNFICSKYLLNWSSRHQIGFLMAHAILILQSYFYHSWEEVLFERLQPHFQQSSQICNKSKLHIYCKVKRYFTKHTIYLYDGSNNEIEISDCSCHGIKSL